MSDRRCYNCAHRISGLRTDTWGKCACPIPEKVFVRLMITDKSIFEEFQMEGVRGEGCACWKDLETEATS